MPRTHEGKILRGKIIAYNLNACGEAEGVVLDADGLSIQVNFPLERKTGLRAILQLEQYVELFVRQVDSPARHAVYVASGVVTHAEGIVTRLNYAHDGGVNGYQLDNGMVILCRAAGHKVSVSVGDRIAAGGRLRVGVQAPVLDTDAVEVLALRQEGGERTAG